jgi:hypothetical protein
MKFLKRNENKLVPVEEISISVAGLKLDAAAYDQLPLCENGNMTGRWVVTSLIQSVTSIPNLSKVWKTPRDSLTHFQDDEGKIWLPYDCKYRPLSYSEFTACLAESNSHLHFYGDSNIRRSLKAISTGGAWCTSMYDPSSKVCNCEDYMRSSARVPYLDESQKINYFPSVAGNMNASIYYYKLGGFKYEVNATAFGNKLSRKTQEENLKKSDVKEIRKPDAVILNLGIYIALIF